MHRGHYSDALNFLSGQLEFLFSSEDLETLRKLGSTPDLLLLILCEGLELSQISKAENYDESKSATMKTYPCCAALGFWRFRCFCGSGR